MSGKMLSEQIRHNCYSALVLVVVFFVGCKGKPRLAEQNPDTLTSRTMDIDPDQKLLRPLQVGDMIELSGGYDYPPLFLSNPPASKRIGSIIQFIKGQNEPPAAVVRLTKRISGNKTTGDIVVLELRYVGQTWQEPTPVHIELCDFIPEDKAWKDRKQGEWIEGAATVTLVQARK